MTKVAPSPKEPYTFTIETRQLERLEALKTEWHISVSEQIRLGIDMWIHQRTQHSARINQHPALKPRAKGQAR
jgi:hypothetical protein